MTQTKELFLRAAESNDYIEIASWIPNQEFCARWAGPRITFPFSPEELEKRAQVDGGCSYTFSDSENRLIGFCQHWVNQPGGVHLGRIIVSPNLRGGGIGKAMCIKLIEVALNKTGAGFITLRVYRNNPPALGVYKALGFLPIEAQSDEEVLFMKKSI